MNEMTLNMLKNKAKSITAAALMRIEIASEEKRLKEAFRSLGQKVYGAVQGDLLNAMKDDPSVVELVGKIEETKKKIADLETKLENDIVGEK